MARSDRVRGTSWRRLLNLRGSRCPRCASATSILPQIASAKNSFSVSLSSFRGRCGGRVANHARPLTDAAQT